MWAAPERARLLRAWRDGLPGPWGRALAPAAVAYRAGLALHRAAYAWGFRRTRRLPCPVVAVGNLTVGGTGKTPLVEAIARRLGAGGRRIVILSRGYGGQDAEIEAVSDGSHLLRTAREAGDEPVLLARRLPGVPVVIGRDRGRAGEWALRRFGADVLVLDDGFQHRRLAKDVEVVCLDARAPWGRGGLLPRGTLREPPEALGRAHLLVLSHAGSLPDHGGVVAEIRRWAPSTPIVLASYEAEGLWDMGSGARLNLDALRDGPVVAFAGIAAPERFGETLAELGAEVADFVAFPDHHPYDRADLARLEARARAKGVATLVTTEKDAVRLPGPGTLPIRALAVRLGFQGEAETWWAALEARL